MRFRKKPEAVEAFQMTEEARADGPKWPEWLKEAWWKDYEEVGSLYPLAGALVINTLEGNLIVSTDDWIIQGVQGELYPCNPDIFEATYEKEAV